VVNEDISAQSNTVEVLAELNALSMAVELIEALGRVCVDKTQPQVSIRLFAEENC